MSDISFKVPSNYSNIDILAFDSKEDLYYDIEVKYRSAYKMSKNDFEKENGEFNKFLKQFLRPERKKKIEEIIGENRNVTKIFVTTKQCFGKTDDIEKEFIQKLKQKNYNAKVWYFDEIIPELYDKIEVKGHYNSELVQTIRLIQTYLQNELVGKQQNK
jgi:hypothetical protein